MLEAAGHLTLDLAEALLDEGLGLKDATPYNVLFQGANPVFIDALSVEHRSKTDPLWRPLAQFERTFIFPLLAYRACGVDLRYSLGANREGLEPEQMARLAGPLRKWLPPYLTTATIPALLGKRRSVERPEFYQARESASAEQAAFVLRQRLRLARRALRAAAKSSRTSSQWSAYQAADCHYSTEGHAAKRRLVGQALQSLPAGSRVLDLGANLGEYSHLAAQLKHTVVAVDFDAIAIGRLWEQARAANESVLPLVVDLAAPSPGTGWRNAEGQSFLHRVVGQFDCVMMLALVHHLVVTHRIPLDDIVDLTAEISTRHLIIEYVGPEDPLFRRLCRGREELHRDFTQDRFESAFRRRFSSAQATVIEENGRVIYHFIKPERV